MKFQEPSPSFSSSSHQGLSYRTVDVAPTLNAGRAARESILIDKWKDIDLLTIRNQLIASVFEINRTVARAIGCTVVQILRELRSTGGSLVITYSTRLNQSALSFLGEIPPPIFSPRQVSFLTFSCLQDASLFYHIRSLNHSGLSSHRSRRLQRSNALKCTSFSLSRFKSRLPSPY